ncbi:MAG TPA: ATP-binding cassette domain-containing protein, partial [Gemmataceae bacterium]|nr:ATP-binding cassette domain-containing protein [Gemmataceae bacterium]
FEVKDLVRQPVRELSLGERMRMEIIAALLHRPQLLLLDEPTIGLDVVGQVKIQNCLREYNETRGVTMLLTSHYMRDVEALCDRVLVITHGKVVFDGPLTSISDKFGKAKLLHLEFADSAPQNGLERYGEVTRRDGPVAELSIDRARVTETLSAILETYPVVDMSVQDPPLEKMIARIFEEAKAK